MMGFILQTWGSDLELLWTKKTDWNLKYPLLNSDNNSVGFCICEGIRTLSVCSWQRVSSPLCPPGCLLAEPSASHPSCSTSESTNKQRLPKSNNALSLVVLVITSQFSWSLLFYVQVRYWTSVLWRCWLGGWKASGLYKTERWGAGVLISLELGADLHMAQLMPLPLTVSCFSKIQIGFTFLVLAHPGSPRKNCC